MNNKYEQSAVYFTFLWFLSLFWLSHHMDDLPITYVVYAMQTIILITIGYIGRVIDETEEKKSERKR